MKFFAFAAAEESEDIDPVSFRENHKEEEEELKVTTNGDLSDHDTSLQMGGVTMDATETQYEPITVGAQVNNAWWFWVWHLSRWTSNS